MQLAKRANLQTMPLAVNHRQALYFRSRSGGIIDTAPASLRAACCTQWRISGLVVVMKGA
jgi:hypothetical protein